MSTKLTQFILIFLTTLILSATPTAADNVGGADTVKRHLATLANDPDNKDAIKAVAFHYLNVGNDIEAKRYGEQLLKLAEKNNDREFCELYGKIILGATLISEGNQDRSFEYLQQALAIASPLKKHDALLSIYNSLGIYYLFFNDDPYTAVSYYYSALEEARQIGDERRQAIITSNIAGCYLTRKDISGKMLAEEAHEMAVKLNEIIPLYYAKCNLVNFCLMAEDLDEVERLINEIEQIHTDAGFSGNSDMHLLRALLYEKRGEIEKTYASYARAMETFADAGPSTVAATYLSYAQFLRKKNQINDAITILEHALTYTKESNILIHTPEIIKELSLCYRDLGDLSKALDYSVRYQQHQDSAMNINRERVLQETRIKHDIYSREQQISEQKIELLANRNRIIVLASSVVLLLLMLCMLYYIHKKKDRLYSAIVMQNRDYINREKNLLAQIEKLREHTKGPTAETPKESNSGSLPEEKLKDLITRFTTSMIEEKLFTDPSITVGSVADNLGTNRTYLSRAINESTGKTFTQIINEYRIREAINLISDLKANIPLKQIASDVGFNSISTFYVTFQTLTGMTPARYRSKLKEI